MTRRKIPRATCTRGSWNKTDYDNLDMSYGMILLPLEVAQRIEKESIVVMKSGLQNPVLDLADYVERGG
jgi:hypothetical protein